MRTDAPKPKYYICYLITHASRKLLTYYNRVLEPLGLTVQQAMALGIVLREDKLSLGVFAERSGIGKAAAVAMIDRLETLGLVTREPHPDDSRLIEIRSTQKARDLAPEIGKEVTKLEETLESVIGVHNLEVLVKGLSVIRDTDL